MKALAWSVFLSTFCVCITFGPPTPEELKLPAAVCVLIGIIILLVIPAPKKK
jgi:uncharacterized membrane protein YccC